MTKEKQIEEMTDDISCIDVETEPEGTCCRLNYEQATTMACGLTAKGWHKQSEGEWILTGTFKSTFPLPVADLYTACSVCRWTPPKDSDDYKKYNYCPNCGAKMKGGEG